MKKITAMLNSPVKIAGFAACAVLLIGLIVFGKGCESEFYPSEHRVCSSTLR